MHIKDAIEARNIIFKRRINLDPKILRQMEFYQKTGTAKMRPRARLIALLGEELISDEPVAVVELVKNAYDADAKIVKVIFDNSSKGGSIIVSDDGHGMSLDVVINSWFEPGTISKRSRGTSPNGRIFQGAKGIGRFAAARLANGLLLESFPEGGQNSIFVLLDWGQFDEASYLDDISIQYELRPPLSTSGTTLSLEGLRRIWDEEAYQNLHKRLSRLISPFQEIKNFSIFLEIPEFPELSGAISPPELILKPKYRLKGDLHEDGTFHGQFFLDEEEFKKFENLKIGGKDFLPNICGKISLEIRAWDRDKDGLLPISEKLGISTMQIRTTLNSFCGVSIYRDGFRVHPYGEPGNDWLKLDARSRQNPSKCLANNQIVAAIKISKDGNPQLEDRSNREGLVHNDAYDQLMTAFEEILLLLEAERIPHRPKKSSSGKTEQMFEAFDLSPTLKTAERELGAHHPITEAIRQADQNVSEGLDRIQEYFSRLLMSAGLGQMVDIVVHEIGAPLGKTHRTLETLERKLKGVFPEESRNDLADLGIKIKGYMEQIHSLRQRLDPQTPAKRGRSTEFDLREEIVDGFHLYSALIVKQGIKWSVEPQEEKFIIKMPRSAFGQVMANLIDNSVFWIIRHLGSGNGGLIHVRITSDSESYRIIYCDNGPGIPEDRSYQVFEPYFTTKPTGMGLGLYISRLVLEPYGSIILTENKELSGACFEIKLEKNKVCNE